MIYLDNAATTQVDGRVLDEIGCYFRVFFENPSSIYSKDTQIAVGKARKIIADSIGAEPDEIYFTSGGSEADNWALKGLSIDKTITRSISKAKHIITSKIEHHAILNTCKWLEQNGYDVTYLDVDNYGSISLFDLRKAIRPNTILISIMTANNEIGTIQSIQQIGEIAKECNIPFHTDAVQAFGHIPINVKEMNIDMLSASGHKIYAPKGIGFLYVNNKIKLNPLIHGGSQERHQRAGTLNVPGIVGMGKATELFVDEMETRTLIEKGLQKYFMNKIVTEISNTKINGSFLDRLPNNINICFPQIRGEILSMMLAQDNIFVSTGSACTSGDNEPSHVLKAIGLSDFDADHSIRFTLSYQTTKEEIDYVVNKIKDIIEYCS